MATSANRSHLQPVIAITLGKLLLGALCLLQCVRGDSNAACKTVPDFMKEDSEDRCCEIPEFFRNESLTECWADLEKSGKSEAQKSCEFSACIFKRDNHMKSDGRMDADKLRSFIKDSLKASSEWKGLMEKVVLDECLPMIEKDVPAIRKGPKGAGGDCDPSAAILVYCAFAKLYARCPSSDWTGSKQCDEWKAYFVKCSSTVDDLNEMFKQVQSRKLAEGKQ